MKSLKKQIQFSILLSAIGLIVVLGGLYIGINKFLMTQEVTKARIVADTIIAFRNYLATTAPKIEVKDLKSSPFICTPAYVTNQATKILREKEHFYVRQVSDEYRNPNDKPNPAELAAIEYFKSHRSVKEFWELHSPHHTKSQLASLNEIHLFYAKPLITHKSCLKCHGVPGKDVPESLYKELVKYYGNRAFGYKLGEVRGILSMVIPYKDVIKDVNYLFIRVVVILIIGFIIGTLIFFRITKKIELSIEAILQYFKNEVSKRIYKPLKASMEFIEFEKLRDEINRTIKTIKNYKGEVYKKLYYHPLTNLPNRVKFFEVVEKKERPVVIINIDKFREINAYFGPEVGDRLIFEVAKRLKSLGKKYKFKVYHLDIDEFALLFLNEISKAQLVETIQQLFNELEEPYIIENHEIVIKFRAGVSYYKKEYVRAEIALDKAKDLRKDIVFGEEVISSQKDYESNLKWFKKLKRALEEDRIVPFYQPIVDRNGNVIKYEALVRLIDEDGKVISPFFFLDIAKRSRMYLEITRRVIEKAFKDFESRSCCGVSINLDLNDIEDDKMREFILEKITNSDVKVTFEIVESEDVRESEMVRNYLRMLQKLGAEVYIDDFGSGYANFDYLIKLNPNGVKIDGSLIKDILTNKNNEIIVKTIINFAKGIGIKTVAEYVENEEIFNKLKDLGIDYFQGYYFSPPIREIKEKF